METANIEMFENKKKMLLLVAKLIEKTTHM